MDEISLTGNPFVDTGLAVIGSLAKLNNIEDLRLDHIKKVHGDGSKLVQRNSRLKVFNQIFGTNSPLFQPSYGYKKGIGPSEDNRNIYKATVAGLLDEIGRSSTGSKCWSCGKLSDFDFGAVCRKAIENNGKKVDGEKYLGRDWFPLAGSLGNDAQALPAASQPPHICPQCLFAIQYLPLGSILLEGMPAVFQCTSTDLWYELTQEIVNEVDGRINAGQYETLGKNEGSKAVMRRMLSLFNHLQDEWHHGLPKGTFLYVWRFSNSGTSPECMVKEIPDRAIEFLWKASQSNLCTELESLVGLEGKNPHYSLFNCILKKRD